MWFSEEFFYLISWIAFILVWQFFYFPIFLGRIFYIKLFNIDMCLVFVEKHRKSTEQCLFRVFFVLWLVLIFLFSMMIHPLPKRKKVLLSCYSLIRKLVSKKYFSATDVSSTNVSRECKYLLFNKLFWTKSSWTIRKSKDQSYRIYADAVSFCFANASLVFS